MKNRNKPQKTESNGIVYGVSIGMLVEIVLGCWLNNLALWMCIGITLGAGAAPRLTRQKTKKIGKSVIPRIFYMQGVGYFLGLFYHENIKGTGDRQNGPNIDWQIYCKKTPSIKSHTGAAG